MRLGAAAVLLTLLAFGPDALAQPADPAIVARQKYAAGTAAMNGKKFEEAALDFEAAGAVRPAAPAFYAAAQAWAKVPKPERAAEAYARCLTAPGLTPPVEQDVKEQLAMLESLLGKVDVKAPPGYRVQLDSNSEWPAPATLYGKAGSHNVTIILPDQSTDAKDVALEVGKTATIEIQPPPPKPPPEPPKPPEVKAPEEKKEPPPPPPPPPPPRKTSLRETIGFTAIGLGAGTLLGGVVLGLEANEAGDAYNAGPTQAALDHANNLALYTNVALVAGGVFVAGGVALVLWPAPKDEPPASAEPEPAAPPPAAPKNDDVPPPEKAGRLLLVPAPGGVVLRGTF